jgi:hypothetical protein
MKSYISILTQSLLNPTHANVTAENTSNTTQGKKTNKKVMNVAYKNALNESEGTQNKTDNLVISFFF